MHTYPEAGLDVCMHVASSETINKGDTWVSCYGVLTTLVSLSVVFARIN